MQTSTTFQPVSFFQNGVAPLTSYRLGFKGLRIKEFYLPTWLVSI